jgi:hypothetical protein
MSRGFRAVTTITRRTRAPRDAKRRTAAQRLMRDACYCETPAWQAAVYGRTADFVFRRFRALANRRTACLLLRNSADHVVL